MVYKLFSEGFESRIGSKAHGKVGISGIHIRSESLLARLLISFIRVLLFVYDFLSYPIYFGLQRPDLKTRAIENQDVTAKTLSGVLKNNKLDGREVTTVNEIFARSLTKYANESCLGYRAVVTCPVLTVNEEGKHVLQEKSFRSDYTWYTYEQIGRRVQDIASGLYHYAIYPGSRALFLANACLEWFIASQACFQIAAQLVVAPEITSPTSLATIIERSNVEVIFASCDRIELLCQLFNEIKHELIGVVKMKKIILIDWQFSVDFCEPLFAKLRDSSRHMIDEILSMGHVEEMGVENPIELSCTKYLNQSASGNSSPALSRPNYNGSNSRPNSGLTTPSMGLVRASRTEILFGSSYSDSCRPLKKSTDSLSSGLHRNPKPRDLAMIVFSHGTLGKLKGVLIDHNYLAKNCLRLVAAGIVSEREVFCSILTLDNLTEFITQLSIFSSGGSIGYSCSLNTLFYDGKDLFKRDLGDIEALRPSLMLARPYMLERLKASINDYLALQMNPLKKFLLTKVLFDYKRYWARRNFTTPIIDRLLCTETSKLFGGRMRRIMCDGLTDCSDTRDFFGQIVNIPIREICGADEVPASLISAPDSCQLDWQRRDHLSSRSPKHGGPLGELSGFIWRVASQLMPSKGLGVSWTSDASGGVSPEQPNQLLLSSPILSPTLGVSIKLEDWEDFRRDSSPLPSGRLLIGGDAVCTGYFWGSQATPGNDDSSASFEVVDSVRWFRANYVARMLQNGCIEIISAISDLIKMSDGQLISLSQIEHILKNSQFVDNVCAICGDDKNFIIALVVPNLRRLALKSPGEANLKMAIGSTAHTEPEELTDVEFRREVCNDRLLCEFVSDHLGQLFSEAGLGSLPSKFHLVPEIWTPQTELVTPSFEPKRAAIQRFYAADIQSLFRMRLSRTDVRLSARLMRRSNGKVLGSSSRLLGQPTGSASNNSRMSY